MERKLSPLFTWRSAIADSELKPTLRHVALTLSLHMNERGGSAFPSLDTIAAESGRHRSTVCRSLLELERLGWLARVPGGGRKLTTTYTATVPAETVAERDGSGYPQSGETVAPRTETVAPGSSNSRMTRPKDVSRTSGGRGASYPQGPIDTLLESARARCSRLHDPAGLRYTARGLCEPCDALLSRATALPAVAS